MECFSFYVPSVAGLTHELDCSPALSLNLQSGLVHYPVSYTKKQHLNRKFVLTIQLNINTS